MGNGAVGGKYDQENNAMSNQLLLERGYQINLMRRPEESDWLGKLSDEDLIFCQTVNFVKTKDSNVFFGFDF